MNEALKKTIKYATCTLAVMILITLIVVAEIANYTFKQHSFIWNIAIKPLFKASVPSFKIQLIKGQS